MNKSILFSLLCSATIFSPEIYCWGREPDQAIKEESVLQCLVAGVHFKVTEKPFVRDVQRAIFAEVRRITQTNPPAICVCIHELGSKTMIPLATFLHEVFRGERGMPPRIELVPQEEPGLFVDCQLFIQGLPERIIPDIGLWRECASNSDCSEPKQKIEFVPRGAFFRRVCSSFHELWDVICGIDEQVLPLIRREFTNALSTELTVCLLEGQTTLYKVCRDIFNRWQTESEQYKCQGQGTIQTWYPIAVQVKIITEPKRHLYYMLQNGLKLAVKQDGRYRFSHEMVDTDRFHVIYNPSEHITEKDIDLLYSAVGKMVLNMGMFLKKHPQLLEMDADQTRYRTIELAQLQQVAPGEIYNGNCEINLLQACDLIPCKHPVLILKTPFRAMQQLVIEFFLKNHELIEMLKQYIRE